MTSLEHPIESLSEVSSTLDRGKWMVLLAAFLGWMFDGLEMGIFPLVARPALKSMLEGTVPTAELEGAIGLWHGRIDALFLFGAAFGGLVFGWMGDKIGRVRAMSVSILTYSLFTGLCYFAQTPLQIGLLRFISAIGMGGEWSLGVALVMECWPERHRPMLAGLIGAASNVGFCMIGFIGMLWPVTSDTWRYIMLAGAAPALLTFVIRIFVPESERWQESVKTGPNQPLKEIFAGKLLWPTLLAILFASIALLGTWGAVQKIPAWVAGLPNIPGPGAKATAQLWMGFGAIVGCLIAPLVGAKFGRRPTYFALCLLSLLACGFLFRTMTEWNVGFVVMVTIVGAITAAFYGWLPLYLPELFPTRVRATAQGIAFNFGRILAGFGALAGGSLVQYYGSYAQMGATISLIYVLGMVVIWLAPETKGKPLPD